MSNLKFQAFQKLKNVFGEDTETVIEYIESTKDVGLTEEKAKNIFLTKQEFNDNSKDFKALFASKEDLANAKNDLIKWVFGIFIALMIAIIGLYFKK